MQSRSSGESLKKSDIGENHVDHSLINHVESIVDQSKADLVALQGEELS